MINNTPKYLPDVLDENLTIAIIKALQYGHEEFGGELTEEEINIVANWIADAYKSISSIQDIIDGYARITVLDGDVLFTYTRDGKNRLQQLKRQEEKHD